MQLAPSWHRGRVHNKSLVTLELLLLMLMLMLLLLLALLLLLSLLLLLMLPSLCRCCCCCCCRRRVAVVLHARTKQAFEGACCRRQACHSHREAAPTNH